MTLKTPEEIYKAALRKWGADTQILMAIEECSELIQALAKLHRNLNYSTPRKVRQEIADVDIMIGQLKIIFGPAAVTLVKNYKLERLERILEAKP